MKAEIMGGRGSGWLLFLYLGIRLGRHYGQLGLQSLQSSHTA